MPSQGRREALLMVVPLVMVLAGQHGRASAQADPMSRVTPSSGLLLIVSMDEARVDVVDEATLRTLASLNTGKSPHEVRVAPDGRRAYVVSGRTITAIDLSTRTVARTFDLGEFAAHDVRISRDGRRLWAACARAQTVLEVDTETGAVLNRYPTSRDGAWFVEVNPDETKLYTPNLEGTSVSVITRATGEVKVLPLEHRAYGIDITPDGSHVLVSGRGIAVVDTSSDVVSRTIATTPPDTGRIRITPDGRRVVVAMAKSVAVFEISTGRLIRETPLQASPKVMALSGDGKRAYLSNPEDHSVTIVDLEEGRVLTTVKTGRRPDGVAWGSKAGPGAAAPQKR
jgi:DNA-binding beta-propeller fold protein YncE